NPVMGRIEQISSASPSTLYAFNGRSAPLSLLSRNIVVPSTTGAEKLHLAPEGVRNVRSEYCQPLPKVGIGTPNIRVDRFLRLAVRFRLVFFALRFLAI